jgi:DNA-binding MarR family transcriptional regulator
MIETKAGKGALEEISFYIGRAYYNYKLLLERTVRAHGLERVVSPGMGHILFTLFEKDGVIIREIARRTELSLPTLTVMLQRMKKAGLVELRRDPDDGRAVRVKLSPLGRSIEARCWRVLKRLNEVLEGGLSEREAETAKRALARMVENMRMDEEQSGG